MTPRIATARTGARAEIVRTAPHTDPVLDFARSVVLGLSDSPRWLPARFLYDTAGSRLFERICDTPEYYLTRTETALLERSAETISRLTGDRTLVELGSGSARKTERLLSAYARAYGAVRYAPVDVSASALAATTRGLRRRYPTLSIRALHGPYEAAFPLFERLAPLLLLFLGSTIGNFNQTEAAAFWGRVAHVLSPGDFVLLGADLVKDPAVIDAAYNDAAGWSAAFTKNVFARMNRELGSGIDLSAIEHEAAYRADWRRVEIFARITRPQRVRVEPLHRTVALAAGERIMTEISRKFELAELETYLSCFGLEPVRTFTDPDRSYALLLLRRERS